MTLSNVWNHSGEVQDEPRTSHQLLSTKLRLTLLGERLQPPTENVMHAPAIATVFWKAKLILLEPWQKLPMQYTSLETSSFVRRQSTYSYWYRYDTGADENTKETMTSIPNALEQIPYKIKNLASKSTTKHP